MLKALINSKIKRKVLSLFFLNLKKSFYARQIQRLLQEDYKSVQRELKLLAEYRILVCKSEGNLILYKLNENCPIYTELKAIIYKTEGFFNILLKKLKNLHGLDFAFIYGSVADGNERADSDIDLMIIGDADYDELIGAVLKTEDKIDRKINLAFYSKKDFIASVKSRKFFFTNVYKGKKIFLTGGENEFNRLGK